MQCTTDQLVAGAIQLAAVGQVCAARHDEHEAAGWPVAGQQLLRAHLCHLRVAEPTAEQVICMLIIMGSGLLPGRWETGCCASSLQCSGPIWSQLLHHCRQKPSGHAWCW